MRLNRWSKQVCPDGAAPYRMGRRCQMDKIADYSAFPRFSLLMVRNRKQAGRTAFGWRSTGNRLYAIALAEQRERPRHVPALLSSGPGYALPILRRKPVAGRPGHGAMRLLRRSHADRWRLSRLVGRGRILPSARAVADRLIRLFAFFQPRSRRPSGFPARSAALPPAPAPRHGNGAGQISAPGLFRLWRAIPVS